MSGEKTEEATDKKKRDSRKKGQVAMSKDMQTLLKIIFFYLVFFSMVGDIGNRFERDFTLLVKNTFSGNIDIGEIVDLSVGLMMYLVMPLVGICFLIGLLSTWMQIGLVIAPEAASPSFKKMNFISNIKNMFSKKSIIQLCLSVVKIVVLAIVASMLIVQFSTEIVLSYRGSLTGFFGLLAYLLKIMIFGALAVFIVLSVIDYIAVLMDHQKNLKMSKNEVKDERKQQNGDPQLKGKRKSMHQNLINSSMSNTPNAKAVVANPTHISVALDYEPGVHDIPFVVAMGEGQDALTMRKMALEHNIPIIRSVSFARQLYVECEEEEYVQEQHLKMAAEVFKLVFSMGKGNSS